MDFSKLKSLASNSIGYKKDLTSANCQNTSKNDLKQIDSHTRTPDITLGVLKNREEKFENQQVHTKNTKNTFTTVTLENTKNNPKPNNLKNNEVIEVVEDNLARGEVTKRGVLGVLGVLNAEKDITTRRKKFDLSYIYITDVPSDIADFERTPQNKEGVLRCSEFDELGYISEKYDHLSERSRHAQVEAITPQQVLGIVETGLERKVFDHLRRYGACQLKTVAKEMNQNEQAIRQVVQNSTLVEYRKGVDECGAWESLLPNEIDYPARFVAFIESQEKIEIDDVFVLLEQCEAYIRQHDQEYLKEWLDFFSRVVRFYRVDVPLLTSLRDACRFRDTENAIWV